MPLAHAPLCGEPRGVEPMIGFALAMSAARLSPLLPSAVAFELSIARCTHIFAASVPLLCPFVPPRCIRVSVLPGVLKPLLWIYTARLGSRAAAKTLVAIHMLDSALWYWAATRSCADICSRRFCPGRHSTRRQKKRRGCGRFLQRSAAEAYGGWSFGAFALQLRQEWRRLSSSRGGLNQAIGGIDHRYHKVATATTPSRQTTRQQSY